MNTNSQNTKWVHFTGIAGTAIGQIAIACQNAGYKVTGSDKGIFPPMSDYLNNNGIQIELGFRSKHLTPEYYKQKYGWNLPPRPEMVIMQGTKGQKHEEYEYSIQNQIPIRSFVDLVRDNIVKNNNSIVVAGTYAKTTTTAMLAWILQNANLAPAYVFGGLCANFASSAKFRDDCTQWSVVEGDEYPISTSDRRSKFCEYKPSHLILTSVAWDHADVFKTHAEYIENFQKLIDTIPADGLIVYNGKDQNLKHIVANAKCRKVDFSSTNADIRLSILGDYNLANAQAAYTMAREIGVDEAIILKSLSSFGGIRRRLEIRHESEEFVVIDDFGASPPKATSAIDSIISRYPTHEINIVFEPNLGSRTEGSLSGYNDLATTLSQNTRVKIYLPRFSTVPGEYISNHDLASYFVSHNVASEAISDDAKLLEILKSKSTGKPKVVAFLGSHGFRGMIEKILYN